MDTMSEEVGIWPEGEEGKGETLCGMGGSQLVNGGSVVGMESLLEYPNHYGSGHTLLLSPTTIPENGVEVDCVMELLITGDNEAILTEDIRDNDTHTPWPVPIYSVRKQYVGAVHTPCLGTSTQAEQQMPGIYCVQLGTSVQPPDTIADLEKVSVQSASPNLNRTPGVVDGKEERFCDIGEMIKQWEQLEEDDSEWKVEEGVRRGGRKLRKRMSVVSIPAAVPGLELNFQVK